MKIYLTKEDGKIYATKSIKNELETMKDGSYVITIDKQKKARSNLQNSYYWWLVLPLLSESTWYTEEEIHELMKKQFLSKRKKVLWKFINKAKSTTELSTEEFNEYIEKIRVFASKFSVYIPLPNEAPIYAY